MDLVQLSATYQAAVKMTYHHRKLHIRNIAHMKPDDERYMDLLPFQLGEDLLRRVRTSKYVTFSANVVTMTKAITRPSHFHSARTCRSMKKGSSKKRIHQRAIGFTRTPSTTGTCSEIPMCIDTTTTFPSPNSSHRSSLLFEATHWSKIRSRDVDLAAVIVDHCCNCRGGSIRHAQCSHRRAVSAPKPRLTSRRFSNRNFPDS